MVAELTLQNNGGAPGTASIYGLLVELRTCQEASNERRRAMLLSLVDDLEREDGYGDLGRPPRTAQIRRWWREMGEPELTGG